MVTSLPERFHIGEAIEYVNYQIANIVLVILLTSFLAGQVVQELVLDLLQFLRVGILPAVVLARPSRAELEDVVDVLRGLSLLLSALVFTADRDVLVVLVLHCLVLDRLNRPHERFLLARVR